MRLVVLILILAGCSSPPAPKTAPRCADAKVGEACVPR